MAEQWIKMRTNLSTCPKVVRISSALKADRLRVIGALHVVWSIFDQHSADGALFGYTPETLDEMIGWPGFAAGMITVGWAEFDGESLVLPRYEAHNGRSAKRRAMDADRKTSVRNMSACETEKKGTREEKRREEKKERELSDKPNGLSSSAILPDPKAGYGEQDDPDTPAEPPDGPPKPKPAIRLAQVTDDATEAYNAICAKPAGLMPRATPPGRKRRQQHVKRVLAIASDICREQYGDATITRRFWEDYLSTLQKDDFHSGRQQGGKGHESWLPDFEYVTQAKTMLRVYEKAGS